MKEKNRLQKLIKNLREKIRLKIFPEPKEIKSVYEGRVVIFTIDKVEGTPVAYAIDIGKTFHVIGLSKYAEINDWIDDIALDKFSVDPVHLRALRITQRKGGKE